MIYIDSDLMLYLCSVFCFDKFMISLASFNYS